LCYLFANDLVITPIYWVKVRLASSKYWIALPTETKYSSPHAHAWGFRPSLTIGFVCIATQEHGNEKTLK